MRCDVAIEIDAPAPEVWAVLTDVTRWPEWTPTMNEVRLRDGGKLGPASSAEIRQPRLPKAVWTVTEFEDGHRFAWTASGPGVRTVGDHRVEPLAGDRCRVTIGIETSGPLARPFWLLAGGLTRRYVSLEAMSLKRRCELTNS
ncbi:MAG: SRPBCC family protein [Actinomycetota bacterium]|nr:SRPBCC family protein [Actinomycetota bacterium]